MHMRMVSSIDDVIDRTVSRWALEYLVSVRMLGASEFGGGGGRSRWGVRIHATLDNRW